VGSAQVANNTTAPFGLESPSCTCAQLSEHIGKRGILFLRAKLYEEAGFRIECICPADSELESGFSEVCNPLKDF